MVDVRHNVPPTCKAGTLGHNRIIDGEPRVAVTMTAQRCCITSIQRTKQTVASQAPLVEGG